MSVPGNAFLFDLDGTLTDGVYQHVLAWHQALQSEHVPLSIWRIHRKIGMSGGPIEQSVVVGDSMKPKPCLRCVYRDWQPRRSVHGLAKQGSRDHSAHSVSGCRRQPIAIVRRRSSSTARIWAHRGAWRQRCAASMSAATS